MNTGQTVYEQLQEIQDKIADKTLSPGCKVYTEIDVSERGGYWFYNNRDHEYYGVIDKVIGHPISLSRVLSALGYEYLYYDDYIYMVDDGDEGYSINHMISAICERKLLNEDNSDCMLNNQSPETIKAIWEIVCK